MTLHRRDYPILGFLQECNKISLEKKILDCGAGGRNPPLAVFHRAGYETHGIDNSDSQIDRANNYAKEHKMEFNIIKGDIRELPYEDESFSFVFSHHTIHHMPKVEIEKTIKEMERVLRPGGLIFVNFPSIDSTSYGGGEEVAKNEFLQIEADGGKITHCFYEDKEADSYFKNSEILSKRKWKLLINSGWSHGLSMIEYTAKKK